MANNEPVSLIEGRIKKELYEHFRQLGFIRSSNGDLLPPGNSKEVFRQLHRLQREDRLVDNKDFISRNWDKLNQYFANGTDIVPAQIKPRLELVQCGSWQANLFRLASLSWSIPVSSGYGRRMRFLVWDDSNHKLIGLIALGDPVFNLKARDDLIGWTSEDRRQRLVNVMDAYVLGAIPPYNQLLGGKLTASLIRTREVVDQFALKYSHRAGLISNQDKAASLAMVTTTSALGRSSVYNRLKLGGLSYFNSIGYTQGWGHFHIPDELFKLIREYLAQEEDPYTSNYNFGQGPNWRMRAIRKCLTKLGIDQDLLKHGINREIFICLVADNAIDYLAGRDDTACFEQLLSVNAVSELAKQRWIIPRATRFPEYRWWRKEQLLMQLIIEDANPPGIVIEGDR